MWFILGQVDALMVEQASRDRLCGSCGHEFLVKPILSVLSVRGMWFTLMREIPTAICPECDDPSKHDDSSEPGSGSCSYRRCGPRRDRRRLTLTSGPNARTRISRPERIHSTRAGFFISYHPGMRDLFKDSRWR